MRLFQDWRPMLAIIVLAAGLIRYFQFAEQGSGIDFFHFWVVPRAVNQWGIENVYDTRLHDDILNQATAHDPNIAPWVSLNQELYSTGLHPTGTPFFYAIHGLGSFEDFRFSYWFFQYASVGAFLLGLGLIGWSLRLEPWQWLVFAGLTLLLFRPVHSDIGVANVNRIQILLAGLIAWTLSVRHSNAIFFLAGVILGTATMYKPNVIFSSVLLWGLLVVELRFRRFIAVSLGMVCATFVAFSFAKLSCDLPWWQWREYINQIWTDPFDVAQGNYALSSAIAAEAGLMKLVTAALALIVTGVFTWRFWSVNCRRVNARRSGDNGFAIRCLAAVFIGFLVPCIAGPVAWGHYFVLTLPLGLLLLAKALLPANQSNTHRFVGVLGVTGLILIGLVPTTWFPVSSPILSLACLQIGLLMLLLGAWLVIGERFFTESSGCLDHCSNTPVAAENTLPKFAHSSPQGGD